MGTEQGSQLVEPAVLRVKLGRQAVQLLLAEEQLIQFSMLQLRHRAREAERVKPVLHFWQMLLNSQMLHWLIAHCTQVPVLEGL